MTSRADSVLAVVAAIVVLFTAMLDPRLSSGLAVVLLVGFALYKLIESRGHQAQH